MKWSTLRGLLLAAIFLEPMTFWKICGATRPYASSRAPGLTSWEERWIWRALTSNLQGILMTAGHLFWQCGIWKLLQWNTPSRVHCLLGPYVQSWHSTGWHVPSDWFYLSCFVWSTQISLMIFVSLSGVSCAIQHGRLQKHGRLQNWLCASWDGGSQCQKTNVLLLQRSSTFLVLWLTCQVLRKEWFRCTTSRPEFLTCKNWSTTFVIVRPWLSRLLRPSRVVSSMPQGIRLEGVLSWQFNWYPGLLDEVLSYFLMTTWRMSLWVPCTAWYILNHGEWKLGLEGFQSFYLQMVLVRTKANWWHMVQCYLTRNRIWHWCLGMRSRQNGQQNGSQKDANSWFVRLNFSRWS